MRRYIISIKIVVLYGGVSLPNSLNLKRPSSLRNSEMANIQPAGSHFVVRAVVECLIEH